MASGMNDYRQNQIDAVGAKDPVADAIRLLQVLNGRALEVQAITTRIYEEATLLPFSDYSDGFRRVQEFMSFCDVIESKLEQIAPQTREPILHEVTAVKTRAFFALLRGMGAYLTALERRGMINIFAQAIFLMQQDVVSDFRDNVLPGLPPNLVPDSVPALFEEVLQILKRLLDRCVDVPDFRFEP